MNIFDIIGPVMVGPSSSHTAGAVRIGRTARKLLREPVKDAEILLYGSFLVSGKGHGTDCAIIAGLLGMKEDDRNIPDSFRIARERGMSFRFGEAELVDAHPNTAVLRLTGESGKKLELTAESIGGSRINIRELNGFPADFSGESPTLIVYNQDKPGLVSEVASMLSREAVNIATMHLHRSNRGGTGVMVIECDQEVPKSTRTKLELADGVKKVTYYSLRDQEA